MQRNNHINNFHWVVLPLLLIALVLAWLIASDGDVRIADRYFYDVLNQRWLGANTLWANEILHRGGRNLMRLIGVTAILAWLISSRILSLSRYRRALGYFALCMALIPLLVGSLKQVTNVDCPWDLERYGGNRPLLHYFESRPLELPRAACFPGAHSSSAFALFALVFLLRRRSVGLALGAGVLVTVLGSLFSIAQQARGAHFLSHDLWSMFVAWFVCAVLAHTILDSGRES
jgi:membrane-associated PAP2 superfamily phosphatase